MKISKANISSDDLISKHLPANYTEALACRLTSEQEITADDLQINFWLDSPAWVDALFKLRNWIVKPFGLKTTDKEIDRNEKFISCIRNGGSEGLMTVEGKSDEETVISLNDKHLKAYFSIRIHKLEGTAKEVKVSTVVVFHNKLGIAYFYTILPFHQIIVRNKMKQLIKGINNK